MRIVGNANASGFRDSFEARCDIDAVAKDIIVVDDYIADVNADSKFNPEFRRHAGVPFGHLPLDFHRTARGADSTSKLGQKTIASSLNYTTAIRGECRIDKRLSDRLKLRKCTFLVTTHQPAIAGDIRRQYSRQSPFHALAGQKGPPGW